MEVSEHNLSKKSGTLLGVLNIVGAVILAGFSFFIFAASALIFALVAIASADAASALIDKMVFYFLISLIAAVVEITLGIMVLIRKDYNLARKIATLVVAGIAMTLIIVAQVYLMTLLIGSSSSSNAEEGAETAKSIDAGTIFGYFMIYIMPILCLTTLIFTTIKVAKINTVKKIEG